MNPICFHVVLPSKMPNGNRIHEFNILSNNISEQIA